MISGSCLDVSWICANGWHLPTGKHFAYLKLRLGSLSARPPASYHFSSECYHNAKQTKNISSINVNAIKNCTGLKKIMTCHCMQKQTSERKKNSKIYMNSPLASSTSWIMSIRMQSFYTCFMFTRLTWASRRVYFTWKLPIFLPFFFSCYNHFNSLQIHAQIFIYINK